ncbi:MAG: uroporphyrinogen decarboxylase family protein [Candidatus Brocadiia bacterium]
MNAGERMRATYHFQPVDHLVRREFYIWDEAIERWKREGLPEDYEERNLFCFDPPGQVNLGIDLGWCEPPFVPAYEAKVVRDEGRTEIIQDFAGRWLRVFKGRRHGFMPDYVRHPVTCRRDWEEEVAPRLDPADARRYADLEEKCRRAALRAIAESVMVRQGMVGGYMYLRALMGPEDLLYAFHDTPDLIHDMMARWSEIMDAGLGRIQRHTPLDELAIGEDICYNHGLLISPEMVREFLLPHYQDVVGKARSRQERRLFFHVDTDGRAEPAVPLYLEAGMDVMSPWEVASGCDVVEVGRKWPELVLAGGIDKRVLADGPKAIDRHVERIIPAMVERGGYIPTCDHGVPDNVSLANYLHYRRRVCELDGVKAE